MQVSINQLSELTDKDRRTITTRLKDLAHVDGAKGAYLYEASEALELIYCGDRKGDLEQKRCDEIDLNMEIKRKSRIPLPIVSAIWYAGLQSFAATLKAARGKILEPGKINELLGILRSVKLPLEW